MLLIANLINPAQHRVDQMNTFSCGGSWERKKATRLVYVLKETSVKEIVNVKREKTVI